MISLCRPFWDHQPLLAAPRACFLNVAGNAVLSDEAAQQMFERNGNWEAIWGPTGVAPTIGGAPGLGDSAYAVRGATSAASLKSLANVVGKSGGRLCFLDWRDGRRLVEAFAA